MKLCSKCNTDKQLDEFCINKSKNDGRNSICKDCAKIKNKSYYKRNRTSIIDKQKIYTENNSEKIKNYQKKYFSLNKETLLSKQRGRGKVYYEDNKEKFKEKHHTYYEDNKDKMMEKRKEYIENNIDSVREYRRKYNKEYKEKNRDKLKEIRKRWEDKNKHIILWRSLLKRVIRQFDQKKTDSTHKMLGYSSEELKKHLESLFTKGMCWENYGEWQVDHIRPLYSFDKNAHPSIVNSLSNLRPLWTKNKEIEGVIHEGNLNRKRNDFRYEKV